MFKNLFYLLISVTILVHNVFSASVLVHQTKEQFTKEVLDVHNEHRRVHNGDDSHLELDEELSAKAQEKADEAARDSDVLDDVGAGENVFMACSTYNRALTGREVTDSWYDEVCHPSFSFAKPDNKQVRSFTQVVWKQSKKLGVGHAVTRKEHTICTYAVALYKPTGNVLGFFEGNVTQGSFVSDEYCKNLIDENGAKAFGIVKFKQGFLERRKMNLVGKESKNARSKRSPFTLNKNPSKPGVNRRTLYYKIPVNFITSVKTGSTYAVPLTAKGKQQENGARRSNPSPRYPTSPTVADNEAQLDAINYGYAYNDKTTDKPTEESPPSYESVDNGDVQADYIKEKLSQHSDSVPLGNLKSNYFGESQPNSYESENYEPSLETIPMIKPTKKTVEDEYTLNKVALKVHNELRRLHGVPPLTLSPKMSIDAENYANYLAENNKFEHARDRGDDGENLAFSCNSEERVPSVYKAIKDWYEEDCTKNYDFNADSGSEDTAHFTQIVWKSTTRLGIGRSIVKRGDQTCTYFVARYNPSGNWMGDYRRNVLAGKFTPAICRNLDDIIEKMASISQEEDGEVIPENAEAEQQRPTQTVEGLPTAAGGHVPTTADGRIDGQVEPVDDENNNESKNQGTVRPAKKPLNLTGVEQHEESTSERQCGFSSVEDLSKFASDSLKVHNYFRKLHDSPPLVIDSNLIRQALGDAKAMCRNENKRNYVNQVGQNVEISCNHDDVRTSAADAVTNWYRQVCDSAYNFQSPNANSIKFTQIIWRSTKKFGTAFVTKKRPDGMFCTYVVAKYSPRGNEPGAYRENVAKGTFSPTICNSLNTLANNAAAQGPKTVNGAKLPQSHLSDDNGSPYQRHPSSSLGTFQPRVNKHAIDVALHNSANFEDTDTPLPLKTPIHLDVQHQHHPDIHTQHSGHAFSKPSCKNSGTENAACRDEIENEGLRLHNKYRRIHNAGDLRISQELSLAAREFAEKLFREKKIRPSSSNNGENIAVGCRESYTVEDAIKSWYKQVCDSKYDFAAEGNQGAGDFTQLVWKDTTQVGIGKVSGDVNGAYCTIIVARYEPAGNILGKFRENVQQGTFRRECCDSLSHIDIEACHNKKLAQADQNQENVNQEGTSVSSNADSTVKRPKENKGINPKAGEHKQNAMPGETPSGAKQVHQVSNEAAVVPHLPTEEEADKFNNECLEIHNALRVLHGSDKLESSPDLVSRAQTVAAKIVNDGILTSGKKREIVNIHGQNTIMLCDPVKTEYSAESIILKWYKEVCEQNAFVDGVYKGKLNHFTQIVWKESTLFGMAKAFFSTGTDHCTIAVALYRPPGNFVGKLTANVMQGEFEHDKCDYPDVILADAKERLREKEESAEANTDTTKAGVSNTDTTKAGGSNTDTTKAGGSNTDTTKAGASNTDTTNAAESNTEDSTTGGSNEEYEQDGLRAHNAYRKIHNAEPLTLDSELSKRCAAYAKKIAAKHKLEHSNAEEGENLAYACRSSSSFELSAAQATRNWYKEACVHNYDFTPGAKNKKTGHFTQVVWKGSKKLGIGRFTKKKNSKYCTYVVARYSPAGKIDSRSDENVERGTFDPVTTCEEMDKIAGIGSSKRKSNVQITPTPKRNIKVPKLAMPMSRSGIVNEEEDAEEAKLSSESLAL